MNSQKKNLESTTGKSGKPRSIIDLTAKIYIALFAVLAVAQNYFMLFILMDENPGANPNTPLMRLTDLSYFVGIIAVLTGTFFTIIYAIVKIRRKQR